MLPSVDEVKTFLSERMDDDPYNWFWLPKVGQILRQLAEDTYIREGFSKAMEIIDHMSPDRLRQYLTDLLRENMPIGMEIIRTANI